jgi:hypothetical protein
VFLQLAEVLRFFQDRVALGGYIGDQAMVWNWLNECGTGAGILRVSLFLLAFTLAQE